MENEQPSVTGSFLRGLLSGGMSGLLMATIGAVVQYGLGLMGVIHTIGIFSAFGAIAPFIIPTAALFSGIMAAKHAMFDTPREFAQAAARSQELGTTPVLVPAMSPDLAPTVAPTPSADAAPEAAPRASWVDRTSGNDSQNRIQQILDNGAMSDKSRAQALLAAREQGAAESRPLA